MLALALLGAPGVGGLVVVVPVAAAEAASFALVLGLVGLRAPRRDVPCEECPGGQLAGQPLEAARGEALAA